jgi:hypothetical protein
VLIGRQREAQQIHSHKKHRNRFSRKPLAAFQQSALIEKLNFTLHLTQFYAPSSLCTWQPALSLARRTAHKIYTKQTPRQTYKFGSAIKTSCNDNSAPAAHTGIIAHARIYVTVCMRSSVILRENLTQRKIALRHPLGIYSLCGVFLFPHWPLCFSLN